MWSVIPVISPPLLELVDVTVTQRCSSVEKTCKIVKTTNCIGKNITTTINQHVLERHPAIQPAVCSASELRQRVVQQF